MPPIATVCHFTLRRPTPTGQAGVSHGNKNTTECAEHPFDDDLSFT
jgi:hypothetical protein